MSAETTTANEVQQGNDEAIDTDRLADISRDELKQLGQVVSQDAMESAIDHDANPVAISLDGRMIWARPIDTRRFMLEMAPHLCFN